MQAISKALNLSEPSSDGKKTRLAPAEASQLFFAHFREIKFTNLLEYYKPDKVYSLIAEIINQRPDLKALLETLKEPLYTGSYRFLLFSTGVFHHTFIKSVKQNLFEHVKVHHPQVAIIELMF